MSRLQEFKQFRHPYDDPPEPEEYRHIVMWLNQAGFCGSGMNGPVPLTWQEIESFSNGSALDLTASEKKAIRHLSELYCRGLSTHANPKSPPPHCPKDGAFMRQKAKQAEVDALRAKRKQQKST